MKCDFIKHAFFALSTTSEEFRCFDIGQRNRLLVDTIVWDEALKLWRVIDNGVLTTGAWSSMQDAIDEVDKVNPIPTDRFISSTHTPAQWIEVMNVHPSIVKEHLTNKDGSLRIPGFQEWTADYGLGYANRLAWERAKGDYSAT